MDKHTQISINYAISHYKLGLLKEIKILQEKYNIPEVRKALTDVLEIMAYDVVEQKEEENENTNTDTDRT